MSQAYNSQSHLTISSSVQAHKADISMQQKRRLGKQIHGQQQHRPDKLIHETRERIAPRPSTPDYAIKLRGLSLLKDVQSSSEFTNRKDGKSGHKDAHYAEWENDCTIEHTDLMSTQARGLATSKTSLGGFGTRISQLSIADQQLVQWYLIPRSPINFAKDWFFPWMSDSLVGLNGVLFFAIVFGGVSQGEKPGQRLLAQRVRLITSIKTSLEDSQRALADEILYAIGFMVVSESLLRNADASTAHMEGLLRFVRARGGLKGIYRNRQLCASLMMTEIHLWNHRASMDDSYEGQDSMELTGDYDHSNVTNGRQVVFSLLLMLQKQANARREEVQEKTAATTLLLALIDRDAPLYSALSAKTIRGHASLGHRFACLLYFNYVLAEYQHSTPDATIEFLEYLSRSLPQGSRSVEDEVYRLLFTLLQEIPESDLRRLWWVIRVMRAMETVRTAASRLMHEVLLRQLELASMADIDQHLKDLDGLWDMVEADLQPPKHRP